MFSLSVFNINIELISLFRYLVNFICSTGATCKSSDHSVSLFSLIISAQANVSLFSLFVKELNEA